jgi:hypothetical protein
MTWVLSITLIYKRNHSIKQNKHKCSNVVVVVSSSENNVRIINFKHRNNITQSVLSWCWPLCVLHQSRPEIQENALLARIKQLPAWLVNCKSKHFRSVSHKLLCADKKAAVVHPALSVKNWFPRQLVHFIHKTVHRQYPRVEPGPIAATGFRSSWFWCYVGAVASIPSGWDVSIGNLCLCSRTPIAFREQQPHPVPAQWCVLKN